jgi:hypothetical protein
MALGDAESTGVPMAENLTKPDLGRMSYHRIDARQYLGALVVDDAPDSLLRDDGLQQKEVPVSLKKLRSPR